MEDFINQLPKLAQEKQVENKKYVQKLKKKKPKRLDPLVHGLHDEVFEEIDCLQCANCCKTTSPMFTDKDITRISKFLKMKEHQFVSQYLMRDEDDFMVLKSAPCTFLNNDNTCYIYDVRPKACSEYPHTDRKKFIQIADLTVKNTEICPAAYKIVEKLKDQLPL